jgi:hypothetical protein
MRAALVLAAFCACNAKQTGSSVATAPPIQVASGAAIVDAPPPVVDAGAPPGTTLLHPVGMAGPFATLVEACHSAEPCGFTDMDRHANPTKPATTTSCPAIEDREIRDPNADDPKHVGTEVALAHVVGAMELRIGSQSCTVPDGLRAEQDIYYMFVKRADRWWRSDALWQWSYNTKYSNGTMVVRWNDQPGRTFVGIAAGLTEPTCQRQGASLATDEMMIRVEPGTTQPRVWAPLVVGRRFEQAPEAYAAPDVTCPTIKTAQELTETWPSPDDLQLTGSATWPSIDAGSNGVFTIGWHLRDDQPSSVGTYRFVRD